MSEKRAELIGAEPLLLPCPMPLGIKRELALFIALCAIALLSKCWELYGHWVIEAAVMEHGLGNVPDKARIRFKIEGDYAPFVFYGFMALAALVFFRIYDLVRRQLICIGLKGLMIGTPKLFVLSLIPLVNLIAPWFVLSDLDRANQFARAYRRGGSVWKLDQFRSVNWWVVGTGVMFFVAVVVGWETWCLIDLQYDVKIKTADHFVMVLEEIRFYQLISLFSAACSATATSLFLWRQHRALIAITDFD